MQLNRGTGMKYFNSRPSARGDNSPPPQERRTKFQFTPLREGRPQAVTIEMRKHDFNSRPSARGDFSGEDVHDSISYFNSRPSARGDRSGCACSVVGGIFQFTPLREGRPERMRLQRGWGDISIHAPPRGATAPYVPSGTGRKISIHAPPRGATNEVIRQRKKRNISIHAPPRGATGACQLPDGERTHFNSRPSARGDAISSAISENILISIHAPPRGATFTLPTEDYYERSISIHAPPRGATMVGVQFWQIGDISIHAPPRGATSYFDTVPHKATKFQFTPLREGRLTKQYPQTIADLFQFTPLREGRPLFQGRFRRRWRNFNSRPSARGDTRSQRKQSKQINFNSRPSARGDGTCQLPDRKRTHFNSRPSARGDVSSVLHPYGGDISIHAPPRGATRGGGTVVNRWQHFNSRPSARGDSARYSRSGTLRTFQFTPLREGRLVLHVDSPFSGHFNSRPSARGDLRYDFIISWGNYFNSRPSARGDDLDKSTAGSVGVFQFTPLREGRRCKSGGRDWCYLHFNSRPSARGDVFLLSNNEVGYISIHAPPRGAT